MRPESEVLQSLLDWALTDPNIRTILLDGSRADPSRSLDEFSDFDVAVIVQNLEPIPTGNWIDKFGDPMVRWPLSPQPTLGDGRITQLVLYSDGVRIDFQFGTADLATLERPGPYWCTLFDHDRISERLTATPVAGTWIDTPDEAEYMDRINAFWWDITYVAKALRRDELDYARYVMEGDLRFNKLHPLIRWHIGAVHGRDTDVGIFGRWFRRYLIDDVWERYLETFSGAEPEDQWRAMFAMCRFVQIIGQDLADRYDFSYPEATDQRTHEYLAGLHMRRP